MTDVNLVQIAREHLDVVLIVVSAYALAAWLVFDYINRGQTDEAGETWRTLDDLGDVNMRDLHRIRQADRDVVDSSVVRAAHVTADIERILDVPMQPQQRKAVYRHLLQRLRARREQKVANG